MNNKLIAKLVLGLLVTAGLAACGGEDRVSYSFNDSETVLSSSNAILFEGKSLAYTRMLSLDEEALLPLPSDLEGEVVDRGILPDGRFALLTQNPASLLLVSPRDASFEQHELQQGFDRLSIDPWGRVVMLSYSPYSVGTGDNVFFNANEVAAMSLDDGSWATYVVQGQRPSAFTFAPPLTLENPGEAHDLVLVHGQGQVVFLHLGDVDGANRQRLVRLDSPTASTSLQVHRVLFADEDPDDPFDAVVFLSVHNSNQLYAISLLPGDPGSGRLIQPSINLIPLSSAVSSMTSFIYNDEEYLLITAEHRSGFTIVHVPSQTAKFYSLSSQLRSAMVFDEVRDGHPRPTALLYDSSVPMAALVDLDRTIEAGEASVLWREVGNGVAKARIQDGEQRLAVLEFSGSKGVAVIPLATRIPTPIPTRSSLVSSVLSETHFIGAVSNGQLAWVDLVTQANGQMDLKHRISSIIALPEADRLVVIHADDWGHFSILTLSDLAGGVIAEWRGLTFNGLFDQGGN